MPRLGKFGGVAILKKNPPARDCLRRCQNPQTLNTENKNYNGIKGHKNSHNQQVS